MKLAREKRGGSLDKFIKIIKSRKLSFLNKTLCYQTDELLLELEYRRDFKINGCKIDVEYQRLDTRFVKAKRKPQDLQVSFKTACCT